MKLLLLLQFLILTQLLSAQTFTEAPQPPPFEGVRFGSIAFADVDGDNDFDVLITGENNAGTFISKLYINDGVNTSTDVIEFSLDFTHFPNPTKEDYLYINYNAEGNGFVIIKLYDSNGHLLIQQKEFVVPGQQTFEIEIPKLSPGSYFIHLNDGKRRGSSKFIVE